MAAFKSVALFMKSLNLIYYLLLEKFCLHLLRSLFLSSYFRLFHVFYIITYIIYSYMFLKIKIYFFTFFKFSIRLFFLLLACHHAHFVLTYSYLSFSSLLPLYLRGAWFYSRWKWSLPTHFDVMAEGIVNVDVAAEEGH